MFTFSLGLFLYLRRLFLLGYNTYGTDIIDTTNSIDSIEYS